MPYKPKDGVKEAKALQLKSDKTIVKHAVNTQAGTILTRWHEDLLKSIAKLQMDLKKAHADIRGLENRDDPKWKEKKEAELAEKMKAGKKREII